MNERAIAENGTTRWGYLIRELRLINSRHSEKLFFVPAPCKVDGCMNNFATEFPNKEINVLKSFNKPSKNSFRRSLSV